MPDIHRESGLERDSTTCSLDFTDCATSPERRVRFDLTGDGRPRPKRRPGPVMDQVITGRAVRAKTAAAKAVCTAGPRAGAVPTAEDEAILAPIIAQIALERDKGASRGSEQWGCVEEREEAQSWKHAAALANELPESCIAQLLGGPAAVVQVPCARERVDIAVSAIRRRGGPAAPTGRAHGSP